MDAERRQRDKTDTSILATVSVLTNKVMMGLKIVVTKLQKHGVPTTSIKTNQYGD
jgi:hypothetical protein